MFQSTKGSAKMSGPQNQVFVDAIIIGCAQIYRKKMPFMLRKIDLVNKSKRKYFAL